MMGMKKEAIGMRKDGAGRFGAWPAKGTVKDELAVV